MLFLVAGVLKVGSEPRMLELRDEWNEHLSQPNRQISLFGALRDREERMLERISKIEGEMGIGQGEQVADRPYVTAEDIADVVAGAHGLGGLAQNQEL